MRDNQSKLVLILGGARAGKSTFALRLAEQWVGEAKASFIATAQPSDEDMASRITRHREERPPAWSTIEEPYRLDEAFLKAADSAVVIVDCLTLFVSNWLLRAEDEAQCGETVQRISASFLSSAKAKSITVICVSNEVGMGIVPDTKHGRSFRDVLGRVNQQFADVADEVYLLAAGVPLRIKPTPT